MSKHTPGPWDADQLVFSRQFLVTRVVRDIRDTICKLEPAYDCEANARLIAAAPELLEACKAMEKHIMDKGWSTSFEFETLNKLSSAIAKAAGEK